MVLWFIVLEVELHDQASEFGRGSDLLHIIWTQRQKSLFLFTKTNRCRAPFASPCPYNLPGLIHRA